MNIKLKNDYLVVLKNLRLFETKDVLLVSIKQQKMYHQKEGKSVKTYVISTSLKSPSCQENSFGTPWGLHQVCEVIGLGQSEGMVFKGRNPIGICYWECGDRDREQNLITSRILRLVGLENGLNVGEGIDTFERYVYIHGTNKEDMLGQPASSGCIQVSNKSAVELAERIPTGTHLYISLN